MTNDASLIERARFGDDDAFADLVERYQALAFRAAYLITGNAQEAEDATQEGLIRAHAALGRFRIGEPFRPWLLRIVTNAARDRKRSSNRNMRLAMKLDQFERQQPTNPSPEGEAVAAERNAAVAGLLNELPESDRIVLTYRYFLDLRVTEIAAILDVPPSTVRSRLLRARNRLRTRLETREHKPAIDRDRKRDS